MAEEQPVKSASPHPHAAGERWGDPISEERQAELKALEDKQREWVAQPDAARGASGFQSVELTGADVFWLAAYSLAGRFGDLDSSQAMLRDLSNGHAESMTLFSLSTLHLEGASLSETHLEGAYLLTCSP